jgi:hypothetical protein
MGPRLRLLAALVPPSAALCGCFPPSDGRDPPLDRIYFPVGLALSGGEADPGAEAGAPAGPARWLYVANSNFDLQFNAGSLQAYDLDRLRRFVPSYCESDADCASGRCDTPGAATHRGDPSYTCVDPDAPDPCLGLGRASAAEQLIAPGRCNPLEPTTPPRGASLLAQAVGIGAFVTDLVYRRCDPTAGPCGPEGRLFLPVRGDATLHWIDVVPDGRGPGLECGQDADGACDAAHRRGDAPQEENQRDLRLTPEPYGIAVDADGRTILVTHQVDGHVSLFVNDWRGGASGGPRLAYVLPGLPSGAVAAASVPEPRIVLEDPAILHDPGFLVTFRNSPQVRLVRYIDDARSEPERDFLEASRFTEITTNSVGFDSRGVAVDDRERAACETRCDGVEPRDACLRLLRCASVPLDVFVVNRTPPTLVIGQTQPNFSEMSSDDLPRFYDTVAMAVGAARVVVGDVIDSDGTPVRRVFVVCFDSRKVFVYDPAARRIETIIQTGRGPQAFAVDPVSGLGFIAHFTDSYIGVVDLDRRHRQRYGQILLSMGTPTPPRASK